MKLRLITLAFISVFFLTAASAKKKTTAPVNDRQQWVELCYRIAAPVLENMSKGELQKNMQLELSPTWDGRDKTCGLYGNVWQTDGRHLALAGIA